VLEPEVRAPGFVYEPLVVLDLEQGEFVIDLRQVGPDAPVGPRPIATSDRADLARAARGATSKRALDLVAVLATAPAWIPLAGILAALVRSSSPGPAFFVQPRVGRRGRVFGCVKLRTMRVDAEEHLRELLANDPELRREFARDFKLRRDPRITRVGRVLRITGLDELPQLLAVLSGEMSLVGPRPVVAEETAYYGPYLELVQSLRPGLTGLWQVSGRNDLPYERRVALDVEYALTRTLLGDLRIILRTLLLALRPAERGAY
jgi:lipopolysaccharide/colanic/teichoic acid biosynthesis glycosyltransferase